MGNITSTSILEGIEAGDCVVELAVLGPEAKVIEVMPASATAMMDRSARIMFAIRTLVYLWFPVASIRFEEESYDNTTRA